MSIPEFLQYFDYHISLKILDFYISSNEKDNFSSTEFKNIKTSKLFQSLLFKEQEAYLANNNVPNASVERINQKREVVSKLEDDLKLKIIDFLQLAESCRSLNDYDTTTSYRKKIIDETPFDKLLQYCKIIYENGRLEEAKTMASDVFKICSENKSILSKSVLALWLIYCINIVSDQKKEVLKTFELLNVFIDRLKEKMEEDLKKFNFESSEKINWDFKEILIHRSYLIHYGLFLILQRENIDKYLGLLIDEKFFYIIESSFTYMIKYIIVLSIISKKKNLHLLVNSLRNLNLNDPFSQLFLNVFEYFNLENSFSLIEQCSDLVGKDFFLKDYKNEFIEKCKEIIIENYILVNERLNVNYFSKFLKNENLEKNKEYLSNYIKSLYPLVKISEKSENGNLLLLYKYNEEVIENMTMLKIEEIYKTTSCLTELLSNINNK